MRIDCIRFKPFFVTDSLLFIGALLAVLGTIALRIGWSGPARSLLWNAIGWGSFLLATLAAWASAGAWGVAMTALWGMGAATLFLAHAALTAPAISNAKASNRRVNMLPQSGEPLFLRRRVVTFLVVIFAAMIVSIGVGIAARALALLLSASEADANVLALFTMPLVWVWLSYALLMEHRRMRQWQMLLLWAVPGGLAVILGLAS